MKFKFLMSFALVSFLLGCSGDKYDKYVGYWKRNDVKFPQVLQIAKDGDLYLLNDNILAETDFGGNKKKSMPLKKSDGQLSIENGFGSVTLALSSDQKLLHVANEEFSKITDDEAKATLEKVQADRVSRKENKEKCDALLKQYNDEARALDSGTLAFAERNAKRSELTQSYKEKSKQITNCTLFW